MRACERNYAAVRRAYAHKFQFSLTHETVEDGEEEAQAEARAAAAAQGPADGALGDVGEHGAP
jgi:hypothetical protein